MASAQSLRQAQVDVVATYPITPSTPIVENYVQLYEIIDGTELNITYQPKDIIPVKYYLGIQGRFKHLFKPQNKHILDEWQARVDSNWKYLQKREAARV